MSFYTLSDGSKPTGSAEDSNTVSSLTIPNNTMAKAKITKFENVELPSGVRFLEIKWQLNDTKYKGIHVSQKVKIFEEHPAARDRAINMLVRLFKLANLQPSSDGPPSDQELAAFKGRLMGIRIQQWFYKGKEGNWVSEVHPADTFTSKEGQMMEAPPAQKQQMSFEEAEKAYGKVVNEEQAPNDFDDEIPF